MNSAIPPSDTGAALSELWRIADVERETGIGKDTLRVWERRYGFPVPHRDERGDRLYDAEQLGRLRLIRHLLDSGRRPGQVVGLPRDALQAMVASLPAPSPVLPDVQAEPEGDLASWMQCLRQDRFLRLRERLRQTVRMRGLAQTVQTIIAPLCVEVGHAWMRGDIGVYQEHSFTEIVQSTLREAIARVEQDSAGAVRAPRVLLTTTPGEQHQLGLLMAECFFALQGCERLSMGVCTPLAEIAAAARHWAADIVALSYSGHASRLDTVDSAAHLREQLAPSVELWLGGAAARRYWRRRAPGVVVLVRAEDVVAQVQIWRRRRGLA